MRIGHGFDVHRLVAGRPLKLGGVLIPHESGLAGHSDADVVLHAIANALLGAIGAGDLGRHFPPGDLRYRDADSAALLGHVVALVTARGYAVGNLDVTIVAQAPTLAPYVEAQTSRIAEIVRTPASAVNVKVSSPEGIGALGREEALAAWAVVLLREDAPPR
jgi:2-C-methyl-D-erythritol 2,4-cyclodiphosphate synthase